jgi:hypothetical protein
MGIKSLMVYGNLMSFANSKEQNAAEFKTIFCGVCSLPDKFLPLIEDVNSLPIMRVKNFLYKIIFSFLKKICWEVLHNSIILLREREREREREIRICRNLARKLRKRRQWNKGILFIFPLIPFDLYHCWVNSIVRGFFLFISHFVRPFGKVHFSSPKGLFVFVKLQKKLKLNESTFRDTKRHIPDIL